MHQRIDCLVWDDFFTNCWDSDWSRGSVFFKTQVDIETWCRAHVGAVPCVNTHANPPPPLLQRHQCDSAETLFVPLILILFTIEDSSNILKISFEFIVRIAIDIIGVIFIDLLQHM